MFTNTTDLLMSRDIIFADTCFLMNSAFSSFVSSNLSILKEKKLIVPIGVINELETISAEENTARGSIATGVIAMIKKYEQQDIIHVLTSEEAKLRPDDFFLSYAAAHRQDENILVLTQDNMLCQAIKHFNDDRVGYHLKTVFVKRIASFNGDLGNFDLTRIPYSYNQTSARTNASEILEKIMNY